MAIQRFDVYLTALNPTVGSKMQKTRPCLIISPDEMNRHIATVIVAPMTSASRPYPTRIAVHFAGQNGQIALDQIRTVDKSRLSRRLGRIDAATEQQVLAELARLFAP